MGRVSAGLWGRDPDRSCGGENQQGQVGALEKETEREGRASTWSPLPPLPPQPWAICQEDAANLASRAWAVLNEQREPAVQMDEA